MHQISKQRSRQPATCTPSYFNPKKEGNPESATFGGLDVYRIGVRNPLAECFLFFAFLSHPILSGCSEGAVPGVGGGNWLENSSSSETQDSNDTLIPTGQSDTQDDPEDSSADLSSIEESSPSESSSSVDPEDSNDGSTTGSESSSSEDLEETASDTEDSASTNSTSDSESNTDPDSDEGETNDSDTDSQESADDEDSTSSSTTSDSTESSSTSSTSESGSDDADTNTTDDSEDEGSESTGDDEVNCDKFVNLQYRAANAKFTGWRTFQSSSPSEQVVLRPSLSRGTVDFTIRIPCRDKWYIWIRAYDEFRNDSFRVQVDGSPSSPSEFEVDCTPTGNQYRWTPLHSKRTNSSPCERKEDPWVQEWDSGNHHLIVYPLNAPVLSRIMVSNNPDFVPR